MSRASRERLRKERARRKALSVALPIALVAILGGALFAGTTSGSEEEASEKKSVSIEHPSLGRADAPVTMIEYADFQCPYCGKFARETEPELIERFVDTGILRIEWRDFPYLGSESMRAALAARAAQEQGKFWEFHDAAYAVQKSPNSGTFSDENLLKLARGIGVDMARFEDAFLSERYRDAVEAAFRTGQDAGVTGTPTFVIEGRVIVGAQPLEVFIQAIEAARSSG